jgi:hypothetical protein
MECLRSGSSMIAVVNARCLSAIIFEAHEQHAAFARTSAARAGKFFERFHGFGVLPVRLGPGPGFTIIATSTSERGASRSVPRCRWRQHGRLHVSIQPASRRGRTPPRNERSKRARPACCRSSSRIYSRQKLGSGSARTRKLSGTSSSMQILICTPPFF